MVQQLQSFLHKRIPLTKDMGMELVSFNGDEIYVKAPLKNNINDKGSVFGGSSSALMIISAWSLIKLNCDRFNIDADIVVHKNETLWQKPLYGNLFICAKFKIAYDFNRVSTLINKNRHQRIDCEIELQDEESNVYSTMKAKYVIISKPLTTKSGIANSRISNSRISNP